MKLFVGNLPFSATDSEIQELFEPFGTIVDFHMPLDRDTGRPRGFAFVTLNSHEAGEAAMNGLEGTDFGGRELRINEAIERERSGGGGGGGGGGYRGGGGGGGGRDRDKGRGRKGGGRDRRDRDKRDHY